ncbi:hypothetical protein GOODEAATRI_024538 [Goodea atripinnis]|uniref:Uncharacterized protein n=1 Tax=Goodea atripinnis TaxID=208336 RepID=A0ABV0PRC7_9TELE
MLLCLAELSRFQIWSRQYNLSMMNPSPAQEGRNGVETSISKLERTVSDMMVLLRNRPLPTNPPTALPAASMESAVQYRTSPLHEPRLTLTEVFKGEPSQCIAFLTQCEIHVELQPSFPTKRSKVACQFIADLLLF